MRFNKQELVALASQSSSNFDREGVLVLKERHNGFFSRSEGCSVRWFRLRGNLLFYLKGPEPWHEPVGIIVLGQHNVRILPQDENGHWPFHIVWENGICYRMATFHESERTLWLKAIGSAPYELLSSELASLKERLNRIRPIIDIATYRMQKGIVTDMNEVPLCELALSCDNLLCDTAGSPPSPLILVYVKFHKGLCVRYGSTEIVDSCSNPCFSKTILFRASDGLTGDAIVRIVVYDVKERVSETRIPMGYTALQLSTIQEAQRLRIALQTKDNKTVGFVTMNSWCLEPSYIGTSPSHSNDRNSVEIPQKVHCHRRSQSLPPRLGLKLKFPSYGSLVKQNFVNSYQVTYRFHSGLGGDITVHEIMAEPKLCYKMPLQLLEIYIQRERELLEELLAVGEICTQWHSRQVELISSHVNLLKHYGHSKRRLQQVDTPYFKASAKKDEASLEFAPINLHLQRMWVHNDTLNKTGFHDVITAGAFAAHTQKCERGGGLIRLVQQLKDISSNKAALHSVSISKIQADYDNIAAMRRLRDDVVNDMDRILVMLQAKQSAEIMKMIDNIKGKVSCLLVLWDPNIVEESLSYVSFPNNEEHQTMTTILRFTERLSLFDAASDVEYPSTSSSSKDTSPTGEFLWPTSLSSSVPNICPNICAPNFKIAEDTELCFDNDYFKSEEERSLNYSFRSVKSAKFNDCHSLSFESHKLRTGSLKYDFKSSSSLEQVSYKGLIDGNNKKNFDPRRESAKAQGVCQVDALTRENNLTYLKNISKVVERTLVSLTETIKSELNESSDVNEKREIPGCSRKKPVIICLYCHRIVAEGPDDSNVVRNQMDTFKNVLEATIRWMRISHAALRLRCESPQWTREHTALQTRRDSCFSQALTTVTTGLLCWLCSVPSEEVAKVLTSGLGPLCGFEGLLSLYSTEKAMWGDMVVAIEDLQTVLFTLTKVGHSNSAIPQVTGTRSALTVCIPVPESLFTKLTRKEHLTFTITAVFFNIGINGKATLAEALGETTPQYHSNSDNLDRLNKYYHKYNKLIHDHTSLARASSSSRTKPLEEVMENLRIAVHKKVPKNVEVLHLAALATRLMNGIRFTSCKSAKDRTGMSVTLEQCSILSSEYHLADDEQKKALDIMRSEGCRRENTWKNIGIRKYAFTKKQVMALPEQYRPPAGTYGTSLT